MQATRVRAQHVRTQTVTTLDRKTVTLACALQYKIVDLLLLYNTLHNAHDTIEQMVQGHVAAYIREKNLEAIKAGEIEAHVVEYLKLERFGISVDGFKLTDFSAVRTWRIISGEMGSFTGYEERLETSRTVGNERGQ